MKTLSLGLAGLLLMGCSNNQSELDDLLAQVAMLQAQVNEYKAEEDGNQLTEERIIYNMVDIMKQLELE